MSLYYRPLLIALTTSISAISIRGLWNFFPNLNSWVFGMPLAILISILTGVFLYLRFDNHLGISNFILQIHEPPLLIKKSSWIARSFISSILVFFGAPLGIEGPAMELSNYFTLKTRPLTSNWFEGQRRTDTSISLATGLTAAFSSPLSGLFIPLELHTGGNTLLVAVTVVFTFIFTSFFEKILGLGAIQFGSEFVSYDWKSLLDLKIWIGCLSITLISCFLSIASTMFMGIGRKNIDSIFKRKLYFIPITGGVVFFFIYLSSISTHVPLHILLDTLIFTDLSITQLIAYLLSVFLGFTILTLSFGSTGVIWPFFIIGTILGSMLLHIEPSFTKMTLLTGGAVFLGTALGTPITASLLIYELTGSVVPALPTLLCALLANEIRKKLKQKTIFEIELLNSNIQIDHGRRHSILSSIKVKSVMDIDFVKVYERDSLQVLEQALSKSRYPFLPVTTSKGKFLGLLSAETITDALAQQSEKLDLILEAKDLLYKNSQQNKTVQIQDSLLVTQGLFTEIPVSAVLNEAQEIEGLLFAHTVRTAYDKEVSQQSLLISPHFLKNSESKEAKE